MLDEIRSDMRATVRMLRAAPVFAAVVVLTLAIGIGATTAMYSVIDAVLLRPLPVAHQDSLVVVTAHDRKNRNAHLPINYGLFSDIRDHSRTLAGAAAVHMIGASTWFVRDADRVVPMQGTLVSAELFDLLGVAPVLGRPLTASDDLPNAANVVVIGESTWRTDFAADPAVIGRPVRIFNRPFEIVGVMPQGLDFPSHAQAWVSMLAFDPSLRTNPSSAMLDIVARVRDGATVEHVQSELSTMLSREPVAGDAAPELVIRPLIDVVVGDMRGRLGMLSIGVVLVLLIACGNVAILMLAKGRARSVDLAVRSALGASRWRITRQLLVENLVLASASSVLAVFGTFAIVRVLVLFAPADLPRLDHIRFDWTTVATAVFVTAVAVLLASLAPALVATRTSTVAILKAGGRSVASAGQRSLGQRLLITSQVALACTVLFGAALLVRSLTRLEALPLGFSKDHLIVARLTAKTPAPPSLNNYLVRFDSLRDTLLALPGVSGVIPLNQPPFAGSAGLDRAVMLETPRAGATGGQPIVNVEVVSEGFFDLFGIPVRAGRGFTERDNTDMPRVAIANEALTQLLWSGDTPVGQSVRLDASADSSRQIVGVVGDTRYRELTLARPTLYVPLRQDSGGAAYVAIRSAQAPASLVPSVRRAIDQSSPFYVGTIDDMSGLLARQLTRPRFSAGLLAGFASLALALVVIGIYSLMALLVRSRTQELGVRLAVGATRLDVQRLVVWEGLRMSLAGLGLGLVMAVLVADQLQPFLYELPSRDPVTVVGVALGLVTLICAACTVPAWRASRVDPVTALRAE